MPDEIGETESFYIDHFALYWTQRHRGMHKNPPKRIGFGGFL